MRNSCFWSWSISPLSSLQRIFLLITRSSFFFFLTAFPKVQPLLFSDTISKFTHLKETFCIICTSLTWRCCLGSRRRSWSPGCRSCPRWLCLRPARCPGTTRSPSTRWARRWSCYKTHSFFAALRSCVRGCCSLKNENSNRKLKDKFGQKPKGSLVCCVSIGKVLWWIKKAIMPAVLVTERNSRLVKLTFLLFGRNRFNICCLSFCKHLSVHLLHANKAGPAHLHVCLLK